MSMNKKQGVAIIIAVIIVVVVFLGYAQVISNLQMNPKDLGMIKLDRHAEISSTTSERNTIIKSVVILAIVSLFLLRDKKPIKQSEYQKKTIGHTGETRTEVLQKDKIMLSLLNLRENGIITEEEFQEKVNKL